MLVRRKTVGTAFVAVATLGTLAMSLTPAEADFSPQPNDVVATGSDIIQNSFNFLADGYHELPGYNTAGNRWRFVSFDSSGDAQGRSAFTDPRLLPTIDQGGTKYVKQSDIKLLNATHQNNAQANLGTKLIRVQIATDRQLIATSTTTNAPTTISAQAILKIYSGEYTKWGDIPGYTGPGAG